MSSFLFCQGVWNLDTYRGVGGTYLMEDEYHDLMKIETRSKIT